MSLKGFDWSTFSFAVHKHIKEYAIPQYGDKGVDLVSDYTPEEIMMYIIKYAKRHGKNSRPDQDLLDLIKIAHYAQMAYTKEVENGKTIL